LLRIMGHSFCGGQGARRGRGESVSGGVGLPGGPGVGLRQPATVGVRLGCRHLPVRLSWGRPGPSHAAAPRMQGAPGS
jgi:hypothetical protein